jgi:hypothetical protein
MLNFLTSDIRNAAAFVMFQIETITIRNTRPCLAWPAALRRAAVTLYAFCADFSGSPERDPRPSGFRCCV